ncbi:hypothetical protein [Actinokineospora sp. NBRC 105648]|uniref:hypothetical protein n=1 Tax=Actinokineospora sp. NBRC 105648 TaxID=3032206 RepID=UPI0024A1B979|nr:hypothetical protein [Actinokineospora sp. NBRC 105648]GLZ43283.1 hypothetical protein Acsp05_69070 [Actinokineospora sp. NBRC 105648]
MAAIAELAGSTPDWCTRGRDALLTALIVDAGPDLAKALAASSSRDSPQKYFRLW